VRNSKAILLHNIKSLSSQDCIIWETLKFREARAMDGWMDASSGGDISAVLTLAERNTRLNALDLQLGHITCPGTYIKHRDQSSQASEITSSSAQCLMFTATPMPRVKDRAGESILSVFLPHTHTVPTPDATPTIGSLSSPARPFGGFAIIDEQQPVDDVVKYTRAWSVVTRHLSPPTGLHRTGKFRSPSSDTKVAFTHLISDLSSRTDLANWYRSEVNAHFQRNVVQEFHIWKEPILLDDVHDVLLRTLDVLEEAQAIYLRVGDPLLESNGFDHHDFLQEIERSVHTLFLHFLPCTRVETALAYLLLDTLKSSLDSNNDPDICLNSGRCHCTVALDIDILKRLQGVGLGGDLAERALALAVHDFLAGPAIQRRCFAVEWIERCDVASRLTRWTQECFQPAVQEAVSHLGDFHSRGKADELDAEQLKSMAMSYLGRSRVEALYDYVRTWPDSQGALLDIKEYINEGNIAIKAHLCSSFSEQVRRRLLHAGASTTEIIGVYISVISSMKLLDPRGVLLEKVAFPIRAYLRSRDDTANIIARSFLARLDGEGQVLAAEDDDPLLCVDVTREVASCALDARDTGTLNWNDMDWTPDPIDAGPEYKSSKTDDVVAHIFGLFDHDDLIKSVTVAFGNHLRGTIDPELIMETKLIELLKSRLDVSKLQAIEVMLKDVRESIVLNRRANPQQHRQNFLTEPDTKEIAAALPADGITLHELYNRFRTRMSLSKFTAVVKLVAHKRGDLYFAKRTRLPTFDEPSSTQHEDIQFDAKVVSGYFWPQELEKSAANWNLPSIQARKDTYAEIFANNGGQQKLEWAAEHDTMDLELELEDRTVQLNGVLAWRWAVLDAFSHPREEDSEAAQTSPTDRGLSAADLATRVDMPEEMIFSAIAYWVSKDILYQLRPGLYAILERRDMMDIEPPSHSNDNPSADDDPLLDDSLLVLQTMDDSAFRRAAPMIEAFIRNMLRTGGRRGVAGPTGITMMLTFTMPDFTYGDEEVMSVLEGMRTAGQATVEGELWRMV
jgi:anaphase-promoting complex subunit 2